MMGAYSPKIKKNDKHKWSSNSTSHEQIRSGDGGTPASHTYYLMNFKTKRTSTAMDFSIHTNKMREISIYSFIATSSYSSIECFNEFIYEFSSNRWRKVKKNKKFKRKKWFVAIKSSEKNERNGKILIKFFSLNVKRWNIAREIKKMIKNKNRFPLKLLMCLITFAFIVSALQSILQNNVHHFCLETNTHIHTHIQDSKREKQLSIFDFLLKIFVYFKPRWNYISNWVNWLTLIGRLR